MIPELAGTTPWFVSGAIDALGAALTPGYCVFEWGSGGSTLWLAQRCLSVTSIEHDAEWYDKTRAELVHWGLDNVTLRHVPLDGGYSAAIIGRGPFDAILIDGRQRAACLGEAIHELKPGGMLVLDDSQRAQYQDAMTLVGGWARLDFSQGGAENKTTTIWRQR